MNDFLKEKISQSKKILIVSHKNPDGDSVGSSMGMYYFLKEVNNVEVLFPNECPNKYKWIVDKLIVYEKDKVKAKQIIDNADLIICLDINDPLRFGEEMGKDISEAKAYKILIDHHLEVKDFSDYTLSDPYASSTSLLIYRFLKDVYGKSGFNELFREAIYMGLIADTGNFAFNSSKSETFETLVELLNDGLNKDKVTQKVYSNESENRLRLMGYCLSEKMVVMPKRHTAYMTLSQEEKKKFHYQIGDTEGFVNIPLTIENIELAVFFMEETDVIRISFRSQNFFDTNAFASKYFKGGGHLNASGGKFFGTIDEAVKYFLELLENTII